MANMTERRYGYGGSKPAGHRLPIALATTPTPKYRNTRVVYAGVLFDSKKERDYAYQLALRLGAGQLEWWSYGPRYVLQENPLITYRPDFLVKEFNAPMYAVDTKGVKTQVFNLKVRLWAATYPDIELRIVR